MKTIKELYQEHLAKFKTDIKEMVKDAVEKDGGLDPVVFALVLSGDKIGIAVLTGLGELFTSDEGKDVAAMAMKELSNQIKPVAIAFASEAWASAKSFDDYTSVIDEDGNYREGVIRPVDDPNRKEILFINWETFDQEASDTWDMIRNNGKLELKESITTDWVPKGELNKEGRFANILTDNYSEMAMILQEQLKNSKN